MVSIVQGGKNFDSLSNKALTHLNLVCMNKYTQYLLDRRRGCEVRDTVALGLCHVTIYNS